MGFIDKPGQFRQPFLLIGNRHSSEYAVVPAAETGCLILREMAVLGNLDEVRLDTFAGNPADDFENILGLKRYG